MKVSHLERNEAIARRMNDIDLMCGMSDVWYERKLRMAWLTRSSYVSVKCKKPHIICTASALYWHCFLHRTLNFPNITLSQLSPCQTKRRSRSPVVSPILGATSRIQPQIRRVESTMVSACYGCFYKRWPCMQRVHCPLKILTLDEKS